ncbi:MAG: acyl-CoA thioesterase [Planctomycetaceae bacterium]
MTTNTAKGRLEDRRWPGGSGNGPLNGAEGILIIRDLDMGHAEQDTVPAIYLHEVTVAGEDIDRQGHVNNLVYVRWMQEAGMAHSSAQGWTPERYEAAGIGWVAKSHHIEYVKPAFAGEQVVVRTWVADFKRATSVRRYRILRPADDTLLAVAETHWAFVKLATGSPLRIPPEVLECFEVARE